MPTLSSLSDPSIYQNIKQTDALTQISDLTKLNRDTLAYQKEKELYQPSIAKAKAETASAETGAEKARAGLQKDYFGIAADEAGSLVNDPRLKNIDPANPKSVQAAADAFAEKTERMVAQGVPKHLAYSFTAPYFQKLNNPNQAAMVRQDLLNSIEARNGAQGQMAQNFVGAGSQETVGQDPLTGGQIVISKDRFGRIIGQRPLTQGGGAPTGGAPAAGGAPSGGGSVGGGSSQPTLPPGMTTSAYQAEVQKVVNQASEAPAKLKDFSNQINMNDRILRLLDDPKVMTGPFVQNLAKGVAGTSLTDEQQEIQKYLANRITNARSNDDQANLEKARGSLGTGKKALKDIIKNDNSLLLMDKMETRAVQEAFGDFTNPKIKDAVQARLDFAKHYDQDVVRFLRATGGKVDGKPVDIDDFNEFASKLKGYKEKNPGKHSKFKEDFEWLKKHYREGD
jgi:topoisomerase IA-like protein